MSTLEIPETTASQSSVVENETPKVTTADVLHRAADLLEEFGWCQGSYGSLADGRFCIGGAVAQARADLGESSPLYPGDGSGYDAFRFLHEALRGLIEIGRNWTEWNDDPGRTKSEVVSLLRQAAEHSREMA